MKRKLLATTISILCAGGASITGAALFFTDGFSGPLLMIRVKTLLAGGGSMGALIGASTAGSLKLLVQRHFWTRTAATTIGGLLAGSASAAIGYSVHGGSAWVSRWEIMNIGLCLGAGFAFGIISWIELSKRWSRAIRAVFSSVAGALGGCLSVLLLLDFWGGFDRLLLWFVAWGALISTGVTLPLVLIPNGLEAYSPKK